MKLLLATAFACSLAAKAALAHAFLDRAVPSVGGTVSGSPRELRLYFTQGVVTAFSHVHVVSDAGSVVPTGKLVTDSADKTIVIVRLGRALPRGTYTVTWVVVSVDTHTTQGTLRPAPRNAVKPPSKCDRGGARHILAPRSCCGDGIFD